MEVRELLDSMSWEMTHQSSEDRTKGTKRIQAVKVGDGICELMEAVDTYIPEPQRANDQPF